MIICIAQSGSVNQDNSAGSSTDSGGSKQSSEKAAPREGSSSSYDTLNSGGESGEGEGEKLLLKTVVWISQNYIVDHGKPPTPQNSKDDRESAVSLGRTSSTPPRLCSLCQHKTPVFGKPPKRFSYKELEDAADAFSDINFLAGGGFGVVHRGVLRDGQVVAVKQLKFGGSQADADFCTEVRVLSCVQQGNVVLLIGYCIEGNARVLVYEYIRNNSLDFHLHGKRTLLDCESRLKIATEAAHGLRYLHEDCRVGCIVHRDLRPNDILLTHHFEPLMLYTFVIWLGCGFRAARLYSEWEMSSEDRVIGTSGYLAPEYMDGRQITHKVDVYAFGIVLLELMTGRRINELQHAKGHYMASYENPDFPSQQQAMARAASLCLRRDPDPRPPMSKVH
ncbi:hypothetical protein C1H46_016606 [Malus baccata]|uniref:Protein kinase domain-containing protein n=1 Tax=Malus baccata TaxID=106549 RepID=A0A540MG59_MALBA|nr:hypothetical protein C1H46_016606 [Malus baccata]